MSSVPKPIIDYLTTLTLRALSLDSSYGNGDSLVQSVRVLDFPAIENAFIVEFTHPGCAQGSSLGIFPDSARTDEVALATFDAAIRVEHSGFPELTDSTVIRERLRFALSRLDTKLSDIRRYVFPADFAGAKDATDAAMKLQSEEGAADPASRETEVTFAGLALDILSGRAFRENERSEKFATYAVWADPSDRTATLILRSYDGGKAVAIAAYSKGAQSSLFSDTVFELEDHLVAAFGGVPDKRAIFEVVEGLTLLNDLEAGERLGRILALQTETEGVFYQPGIAGDPSAETIARLNLMELAAESHLSREQSEREKNVPSAFEVLGSLYLAQTAKQVWSKAKEDLKSERIEVLENASFPGALVLISFDENEVVPDVAVFGPDGTQSYMDPLTDAVNSLLAWRRFGGLQPTALPSTSLFKMVDAAKAPVMISNRLKNLEAGKGMAIGFPRDVLQSGFEAVTKELLEQHGTQTRRVSAPKEGTPPLTPKPRLH